MSVQIFKPETRITVTPPALEKIRKEISKAEGAIGMRLGVAKSGCTGYMYHIEIVEQTAADDHVFQISDDVCVVVDAKSLPFLQGTQIDFVKNGLSAVFKFNNPNVQDQCGCGESFNVKEQVQ